MAHKMAIHAENYKKGSVGALEHHNLRENEKYSNKDIDFERTKDNVILRQPEISQYQDTKNIIEHRAVNQVRSTSIWQTEFIISSDQKFFKELTKEEKDRFFLEAYNYLSNEFGADNITCAAVHYDETTPHMHFDFVPMTEQNKLSRKEVMTRERLTKIQDELPKYLSEKGYNIERGRKMADLEKKDRPTHMSTQEYKKALNEEITTVQGHKKHLAGQVEKYNARIDKIEKVVPALQKKEQQAIEKLSRIRKKEVSAEHLAKSIQELPRGEKNRFGKITLQEDDYNKLINTAKQAIFLEPEYKEAVKNYKKLSEEHKKLKSQVPTMQERVEVAQIRADYKNMENKVDYLAEQNSRMKSVLQKLIEMNLPAPAKELITNLMNSFKKIVQKEKA